jgi:heavy metal sensor kinase
MRAFLRRTRIRLTLAYTLVVGLVLCAGGVGLWFIFSDASLAAIDGSLRGQAQILASGLRANGEAVLFNGGSALPSQSPDGSPIGALVLAADGRVVDQAGQAPDPAALLSMVRSDGAAAAEPVLSTLTVAGASQRILLQRIDVGNGQVDALVLNRSLDEYLQSRNLMATLLSLTVLTLVVVSAASGYWLAGLALRPVRIITVAARDLSEHSLDRRLQLDLPRDEIGTLAATFNQMLDRLEAAFATLQRFTADAAHELRGPLTALRSEVEVALHRPRDARHYRAALETVLAETERLSRVADQLLLLARADAGALAPRWTRLDVSDLLEETAERWRPLATRSGIDIAVDVVADGEVTGDAELLRRLLNNLIDNAVRHTPADGTVTLSGEVGTARWRLAVVDTGPGVDPSVRATLFQRFTRADSARGWRTGGAGLGLSLAAAIAAGHAGTIRLDEAWTGGARFVVDLSSTPDRAAEGRAAARPSASRTAG